MTVSVLEIRNYLLKPGVLEHFIDYFETHFIVTQEAVGMRVLGQFRVIGEPDHFVWLRGFADMQTRLDGLRSFYGGPVWAKYGPRANEMMLDSDNVHLLQSTGEVGDLTCGRSAETVAAELDAGTISPDTGVIAVDFYRAVPGQRDELIDLFQTWVAPAYQGEGIKVRGYFAAEMRENDFPRLPVIQDEDEFVVVTAYESEEASREKRDKVAGKVGETVGPLLSAAPETLLLRPTLRSSLRYLPE